MGYAEVSVNSPIAQRRAFSYTIPSSLSIDVGQAVWVPFGEKLLQGIVLELSDYPAVEETREIAGLIEPRPMLSPAQISLACWISRHYLSPLFDAVALMLPPGFERKALTFISANSPSDDFDLSILTQEQRHAFDLVRRQDKVSLRQIERTLGKKKAQAMVAQLVRRGLFTRSYELEPIKVSPKEEAYLHLAISAEEAKQEAGKASEKRTANQATLLDFLAQQPEPVSSTEAKKIVKFDKSVIDTLVSKGLVRAYELEPTKIRKRPKLYLRLVVKSDEARKIATNLRQKITVKEAALLDFLAQQPRPVPLSEARHRSNCNKTVADALVNKGLITIENIAVSRDPLALQSITPSYPLTITTTQESVFKSIQSSLLEAVKGHASPAVFLLHGVTGSGKTEIYIRALAETLKLGKRGIVLVPEIALTPQTIERFASRFPDKVAVLHSQLSLGEQFDEWQRIRNAEFDVVIGPRSAIFAPQPDLGLIVIDEEHEWTYKQHEPSPRYHARDVAIKLAELTGAVVILGSATPDVETFYHTQRGDYRLLRLPERVTPRESAPLPQVEIVDLREELKAGNRGMFSRSLSRSITKAVANSEQVILFLNRRGAATFIQCRDCGFALRCQRCEVPLTYHLAEDMLACHQCNYRIPVPQLCPRCSSQRIKFLGAGTQKLEQEARQTFSQARLLRWDSDATQQKHSHQEILNRFRSHQADILVGTQMVAKGLDLPGVTLVGVINADTALNLPDFRAGERTFQLLSQVTGRAGRGHLGGRAIIQTYSPEHYAIQAASRHAYSLFYDKEISYRRQLRNPPFSRLASLIYTHTNDALCQREAERMKRLLAEEIASKGIADLSLIGPAPAFIHRLRGRFRWQLILRGSDPAALLSPVPVPQGWTIDIDPVGLA
ncbi:primosomal protein N' [Chloroflexota bacterium]